MVFPDETYFTGLQARELAQRAQATSQKCKDDSPTDNPPLAPLRDKTRERHNVSPSGTPTHELTVPNNNYSQQVIHTSHFLMCCLAVWHLLTY